MSKVKLKLNTSLKQNCIVEKFCRYALKTKNLFLFIKIPKIESKQDMIDARAATDDTELDVYFIFFHNEADERNKHIKSYLECKEKYGHMANFYRTDTGFALLWAEKLGNCF